MRYFLGYLYYNPEDYFLGLSSIGWTAVGSIATVLSSIAVAVTVIYIAKQSKYLKYQTMPIAWFFLMSSKTFNNSEGNNLVFIKNESKYTIAFYYKITEPKIDDEQKVQYYKIRFEKEPLHIYPGLMRYPYVIPKLNERLISQAEKENKKIRIDIHYGLAPEYSPKEIVIREPVTWTFDPKERIWIGPNGMQDKGFLSMINQIGLS